MTFSELTNGRWPDLLAHFCGLTPDQLTDKHQPCPLCGGEDRYRFDDKDGTGSWYCNQCGGKNHTGGGGSGMDLLMRRTSLTFKDAAKRIEQHLGHRPQPPTSNAEHVWRYNDDFYVCRFPGKKIRPLYWDGTSWKWSAPPTPRPIYNLDYLRHRPDAPVLIVEGEKTADAAAKLLPDYIVITWPSGCKAHGKADWTPLSARHCTLWPDADAVGIQAMAKLASTLAAAGAASVRTIQPPSDVPDGWDLADCNWSTEEIIAHIDSQPLPEAQPEPDEPEPAAPSALPFKCLGHDRGVYFYLSNSGGQVLQFTASQHTKLNLLNLAPLAWWDAAYKKDFDRAADCLIALCMQQGVYDPDRVRGRGAWYDRGRVIVHLGNRLIVDNHEHNICNPPPTNYFYEQAKSLDGPADEPLCDELATKIRNIAIGFRWEMPVNAYFLLGWTVLAPVCGALDWRPHVWLTASAGSGKSAVLGRYVTPLLGDMGLIVTGNTTEPGIRQALRADALPVVFDEAESNERNDQARMQAILGLARVASSESRAHTLKGSPEGDTQRYTIRSMFMMSSIATALKQGADKSRFAQLTLRSHTEIPKADRLAHWESLDRDLDKYISDAIGRRLQARTIKLIPTIRKSIAVFTRAAAEVFDSQRLGDQYGTLLAGAWSLQSSEVATRDEAWKLIEQNNWESYSQSVEISDEKRCLQRILQHQLRVEGDKTVTRTIGELIDIALNHAHDLQVGASEAQAVIGRNGIKAEDTAIYISNTADSIGNILRDTPWANCWAVILARIPNAAKAGVIYFKGSGMSGRAVKIPLEAAQA